VSTAAGANDINAGAEAPHIASQKSRWPVQFWSEAAIACGYIGFATATALVLRPHVAATNLAAFYLLAVVAVAVRCTRQVSILASFLSVAAFDFFCVPPYYTFRVNEYEYLITFAGILAVALVISTQTTRLRAQAEATASREAHTGALYRLSDRLAGLTRVFDVARTAAEVAEELFRVNAVIFLPEERKISLRRRTSDLLTLARADEEVAQYVFDSGQKAGWGTDRYSQASALFLPLRGTRETVGVLALVPRHAASFSFEQDDLLAVFANQTALAIERVRSQNEAEGVRVKMQTEEMRSSLLSAVSHDLRTPLASITGSATTLRAQWDKLPEETRGELLDSISDEAERLGRLVSNLLDMTRLESGIELRCDDYPLEEIVGSVLQRYEKQLSRRSVQVSIPEDLPTVYADDVLLGQLLQNLIENALKYSPAGSPLEIAASYANGFVQMEVRDRGPGFPPGEESRVFEKFFRGRSAGRGAGLGLAICRAIVDAHKGAIEAETRPDGGAVVRVKLPATASGAAQ
jgi:two-component system, OmpR family, sensor histidine kinase KdpD